MSSHHTHPSSLLSSARAAAGGCLEVLLDLKVQIPLRDHLLPFSRASLLLFSAPGLVVIVGVYLLLLLLEARAAAQAAAAAQQNLDRHPARLLTSLLHTNPEQHNTNRLSRTTQAHTRRKRLAYFGRDLSPTQRRETASK